MSLLSLFPEGTTPADVWRLQPGLENAFPVLPRNVFEWESELTRQQKALIAAYYASSYSQSRYGGDILGEYPISNFVGSAVTVDESLLAEAVENPESENVDKRLQPILLFVRKLCVESYKLLQRDVDPIFEQGWSEQTLSDVVFLCAALSFYLPVMLNHGIDLQRRAG